MKTFIKYIFFFFPSLITAQDSLDLLRSKLLVIADYQEFINAKDSCINVDYLNINLLEAENIENINFLVVKYRDLEKLQFYFQQNYLNKDNGNYFDFSFEEYKVFFEEKYSISQINEIEFYENQIGKDKFIKNEIPYQCDFIVAITKDDRMFKLKGFKYNDFAELYYRYFYYNNRNISPQVLLGQLKGKKRRKELFSQIKIEDLDLNFLWENYVKKTSLRELNSCYYRDWVLHSY